ncbi:hypothetical protein [Amycolatopsis palatopharyngis]|uniref:hypothetical protein n=1 Tax=Amycolatopsis palatopharyngis TaxID=187982 RepID=UPI001FE2F858|nr:hypothetical protein [Amycolatopsis palatopharyngis]
MTSSSIERGQHRRWRVSKVIDSPFTTWEGDNLHGRRPVLTRVWVRLDDLFARPPDAPRHVIATGLDVAGQVQGRLHGRFPTVDGRWLGAVNYEISYADGRRDKLHLVDQLVPFYALQRRE